MALLTVSGGSIEVPALFLGGVIEAGDLIDQVNATFKQNSELLEQGEQAFASRPLSEVYKSSKLILQIAEVSCRLNNIKFDANEWMNGKVRPQDVTNIHLFFFELMGESGFGTASGETPAAAFTQALDETQVPVKRVRKTK